MKDEPTFASVWDAIEDTPEAAAHKRLKSDLMIALRDATDGWSGTRNDAAARLGIAASRLDDLLRGRISRFDLDDLVGFAQRAGLRIEVKAGAAAE